MQNNRTAVSLNRSYPKKISSEPSPDNTTLIPCSRVSRLGVRFGKVEVEPTPDAQAPRLPLRPAAGFERPHAAEWGPRGSRRPEGEDVVETGRIQRRLDLAAREQGLDLGGEVEVPA